MPSDTVMLVGAFIPIVAILFGGMLLLIPVAGLTLRFALKPTIEAFAKAREVQGQKQEIRLIEQRLALLEDQINTLMLTRTLEEAEPRRRAEEPRQTESAGG